MEKIPIRFVIIAALNTRASTIANVVNEISGLTTDSNAIPKHNVSSSILAVSMRWKLDRTMALMVARMIQPASRHQGPPQSWL